VEHAARGSFRNAFFFSVQTMETIGYGAMFPGSTGANVMVVVESIVSLLLTAMSTGLVVAKVSRPTARVVFTRHAVISLFDGVPTLMFPARQRARQPDRRCEDPGRPLRMASLGRSQAVEVYIEDSGAACRMKSGLPQLFGATP
jgi:hypothetical protein